MSASDGNPRRSYGTGRLYVKSGSWYGRWPVDGRKTNRKLGPVRQPGGRSGLTKRQAEAELRSQMQEVRVAPAYERLTVQQAGDRLVELLELKGRKPATIEAVRSAVRVHLAPHFGHLALDRIDVRAVERFIAAERRSCRKPKSIRNYLGTLHSIFELAIERGWARDNPVKSVHKPETSRTEEIRFLGLEDLDAVLCAVPADMLGAVERPLYLTAAMTGLRQGELAGLQWHDVDWLAGKLRVRRTFARGAYGAPKSRRGSRAVPLADRVAAKLEDLSRTSVFTADDAPVFAHPETGRPLDASKVLKRFKAAVKRAGVGRYDNEGKLENNFHDLRHTFGTHAAAAGVPMRMLQEWMGHRDFKTTLIYADYAPDAERERELVARAFARQGSKLGSDLIETESNSQGASRSTMRGQG